VDAGLSAEAGAEPGASQRTDAVMGREERLEILVGGTALLLFAVVLMFSYMGLAGGAGTSTYQVYATFNRIDGLSVGDDVQLSGIPVGEVAGMTLRPDFRARVALAIEREVMLPVDTSAAIHTDGLFGRKFVVLEPGGDDQALADESAITFTQDSLIVSELLDLVIAEGRAQRIAPAPGAQ
jgi:phospholipid/cholesterol/gamma-HCH transport system substrate-binding protein